MNPTILYQLPPNSHCQMMSYVLQTAEGRLVVIDGGCRPDGEALLRFLEKLRGPRPTVAAWFLTHAHDDHIGALTELLEHHREEFTVERILCNLPPLAWTQAVESVAAHANREHGPLLAAAGDKIAAVSAGERISVDEMVFRVLRVPDLNLTVNPLNNSSIVLRLTVEGGRTVLFVGDLGVEAGEALLRELPPEDIRAEVVQMAHHGQQGVTKAFYEAVAPRVCLWPTPDWLWDNRQRRGQGSGPWKTLETRSWMEELGVREHIVSKDGLGKLILREGS